MTHTYDFCVIGGGITGLTIAVLLLEKGYKVCVFEKKTINQNSSSNNAGQLIPGYRIDDAKVEKIVGKTNVKHCIDSTHQSISLIKSIVSKYKIDCDFIRNKYLIVNSYDNLDISKNLTFKEETYCFNVKKYIIALKRKILELCGDFYENAEILDCKNDGSIYFNNGIYKGTSGVILASNGTDNLSIFPPRKIGLLRTYLLKSQILKEEDLDWPQNFAVSNISSVLHYCRFLPDKSLLLGINPKFGDGSPELLKAIKEEIKKLVPKKETLEFSSCMVGQISITKNGMPIVGLLNNKIFYSAGCYGRGLVIGTMIAQAICDKITKGSPLFDCLSNIKHEDIRLPSVFNALLGENLLNLKEIRLKS